MNEPDKENPKASKRSRRKPVMEPLGWDEIVSQPGMGGYLSFLNGPVPLPHLQGSAPASYPDPGVGSTPQIASIPAVTSNPELTSAPGSLSAAGSFPMAQAEPIPDFATDSSPVIAPVVVSSPGDDPGPGAKTAPIILNSSHVINDLGFVRSGPGVISIPAIPPGQRLRIRRCAATHDGHSLGEEVLYQALWKAAGPPESSETRTIVIGWRGMSQLCRMTPKNCKINTQRLIRKLALEVLSPYNTPESIGTTYRVYSDQAIFERRSARPGLEWVVRSRGVEFVDPSTGISIMPICAHTYQDRPALT